MKVREDNYRYEDERGTALIAFLVVALLTALPVTVFEYSRLFRINQQLSLLTREAAHIAFRQCAAFPESDEGAGLCQTLDCCLNRPSEEVQQFLADARQAFPDGEMRIAIYHNDGDKQPEAETTIPAGADAWPFDPGSPRFEMILQQNGLSVVAEGRAPYESLLGLEQYVVPNQVYEATLF